MKLSLCIIQKKQFEITLRIAQIYMVFNGLIT